MLLTDYFRSERDLTWDFAKQCGVNHGVIRLPETIDFDICDFSHWETVYKCFTDFGITPIIIEPMPNELHDHIKAGDEKRDECIEKVIKYLDLNRKVLIVTDSNIPLEYIEEVKKDIKTSYVYTIKAGEESKNFNNFESILKDFESFQQILR